MAKILIVDDDLGIRELLTEILQDHGHEVAVAGNGTAATHALLHGKPDLVFLDVWMPDVSGLDLLRQWRTEIGSDAVVIVMSGQATIDAAIDATRNGALDFLEKPITLQKFLLAATRGLEFANRGIEDKHKLANGSGTEAALHFGAKVESNGVRRMLGAEPPGPGLMTNGDSAISNGSHGVGQPRDRQPSAEVMIRLDLPLREAREMFEANYFQFHLNAAKGNVSKVAKRTGLERTNLYRKLHGLNLLRTDGAG